MNGTSKIYDALSDKYNKGGGKKSDVYVVKSYNQYSGKVFYGDAFMTNSHFGRRIILGLAEKGDLHEFAMKQKKFGNKLPIHYVEFVTLHLLKTFLKLQTEDLELAEWTRKNGSFKPVGKLLSKDIKP